MTLYTIDSNNKFQNCSQIPTDITELEIAYEGFKSTTGIGCATRLEKITIIECKHEIHLDDFQQCTNLKEVCITRSQVTNIFGFSKLNCKICADLSYTDFNTDYIPSNVTVLNLQKCKLVEIPELHSFESLVELNLGGNQIQKIELDRFPKQLQMLDLTYCDLQEQPDFHTLESLIELNLHYNQQIQKILVDKLPKKLSKLAICFCGLVEQPTLHLLNSLGDLDLGNNEQLRKIDTVKLPKQLKMLNVGNCGLVECPDLHSLESLEQLDLQLNKMQKINADGLPKKLQKLDISCCDLMEFPDLHQQDKLAELNVSSNSQIQEIEPDRLPKLLQILDLTYCDLKQQPDFHSLESLIELNLGANQQIEQIKPGFLPANIQVLNLSYTQICNLSFLYINTKLKELDVAGCKISDINQLTVLKLMTELQKFICYENEICSNCENICEAFVFVLSPNIIEVCIDENENIAAQIKQLQTDINNIKNPFTKTLNEMFDEQFCEGHAHEIDQMELDICVQECANSYLASGIQKAKLQREQVDDENCLISRSLVSALEK